MSDSNTFISYPILTLLRVTFHSPWTTFTMKLTPTRICLLAPGELAEDHFEVEGGEFVFPKDGCAVDFMRFNSIVECAWKASDHFHHTLPVSRTNGISSHPNWRALQTHQDEIPDYKKLWTIRDLEKVVKDAVTKYDEKGKLREPNKKKKQPKPK
ncbi:hypothetical protein PSHT_14198, partial [Puccinia striiformis]